MKQNLKQPQYDEANLINFQRKNIWMNEVKQSKSEHAQVPYVQIAFTVLGFAALITVIKIWGGI